MLSDPPHFIKCGGRVPGFNVFLPCVDPHEIKCALLVDETLCVSGTFSESGRVVGATLKVKGVCHKINLICTYIQPSTGVGWDSLKDFSRRILETPGAMVVIGGDFNAHSSMWGPPDVAEDTNGKRLIEWSDDHDLFILNKWPCLPTFSNLLGQNSWIDVSLVSAPAKNLVHSWTVLDNQVKITDHNTIEFQIKLNDPLYETESFPNFRKTEWSMFSVKLHFILKQEGWLDFKWEDISTNDSLDSKIQELEACIKTVIDDLVPSSTRSTKRRLWWNSELQTQHRITKRSFRKAFKSRYSVRGDDLLKKAKEERAKLRSMINTAKNNAWRTFIEENGSNDLWSTFKRVTKPKQQANLSFVKDNNGVIISDPIDVILAMGRKFFPTPLNEDTQHLEEESISSFLELQDTSEFIPTNIREVKRATFRSKPFGAVGLDGIPNVLIRNCWFSLGPIITRIFNTVLRLQHFPSSWKQSKVVVVPKSSHQDHQLKNLRPISLLPVLGKIFESILNDRLMFFLENNQLLHTNQHGFRKQKSTNSALISMISQVERCIDSGLICYGCSLDIQAAFDSVPHQKLILAAIDKGVPSYIVRLLRSFTIGRTSQLSAQGSTKDLEVKAGTPQGSAISPTLFAMYLDRTLQEANLVSSHSITQAFADDIWVTTWGKTEEQARNKMQRTLDIISNSVSQAGLCLSPQKCQTIRFYQRGQLQDMLPVFINNKQICEVNSIKYLGVILDSKLTYKQHVNHICRKGNERLMSMRRMSKTYWGLLPNMFHTLVTRAIEPMLLYASGAWAKILSIPARSAQLQKLHRRCGIVISGNLRTTAYNSVHLLSGLACLDVMAGIRALSQARLFIAYGLDCLNDETDGAETELTTSFSKAIKYEQQRLRREVGVMDPLKITPVLARTLAPGDEHLLAIETKLTPDIPMIVSFLLVISVKKALKGLAFSWSIFGKINDLVRTESKVFDFQACRESIFFAGLTEALSFLSSKLNFENIPSHTRKLVILVESKCFIRKLETICNVNFFCYQSQLLIVQLINLGFSVQWAKARPSPDSYSNQMTCLNAGRALSCSKAPQEYPNLGWDAKSFKSWCNRSINVRMKNSIDLYYAGCAVKETTLCFEIGSFLGQDMSRYDCSCVSQFLSNHFPSNSYLHRFDCGVDAPTCFCGAISDDRDHLLFECPLLLDSRMKLIEEINAKSFTWPVILSNKFVLIQFVSSIKECWKTHGKHWG